MRKIGIKLLAKPYRYGHNNSNKRSDNLMNRRKRKVDFNCENCGKNNTIPRSYFVRRKHHFCDRKCGFEWRSKQKSWNYLVDKEK